MKVVLSIGWCRVCVSQPARRIVCLTIPLGLGRSTNVQVKAAAVRTISIFCAYSTLRQVSGGQRAAAAAAAGQRKYRKIKINGSRGEPFLYSFMTSTVGGENL